MGFDFDLPPSLCGCAVTTKLAPLRLLTSAGIVECCCDPDRRSNFTATFPRNAEDTAAWCGESKWKEASAWPLTLITGSQGGTTLIKLCTALARNVEWIILTRHCWLIRHYFCPRWDWNPRHPFDSAPMLHINYISLVTFATHRTVPPASPCKSSQPISASSTFWFGHIWKQFDWKSSFSLTLSENTASRYKRGQWHVINESDPVLRMPAHSRCIFRSVIPLRIELLTNCERGSLILREQTFCGQGVTAMCHALCLCSWFIQGFFLLVWFLIVLVLVLIVCTGSKRGQWVEKRN